MSNKAIPRVSSRLRHNILCLPSEIREASGIVINGRRIKSLIFTTDIAVIRNCDADAVFAVYPFTPQQTISEAIIKHCSRPVFCGIGGGTTHGIRTITLAKDAESQGAMGVVMNAPTSNLNLQLVSRAIDIPIVVTVISEDTDFAARIESGASILNVAGGHKTIDIVRNIRRQFPDIPIIATGGPTTESIHQTIQAGANAITFTPPSLQEMFRQVMEQYREEPFTNNDLAELVPEQQKLLRFLKAYIDLDSDNPDDPCTPSPSYY